MQTEYIILSPEGDIKTDYNGYIIEDNREDSDSLIKIDIQAYLSWCRNKKIEPSDQIDILFVGYWNKDGQYFGPEENALNEFYREKMIRKSFN